MKSIVTLLAGLMISGVAQAEYVRLAECVGKTDKNIPTRAVLFVNKAEDTKGLVAVSFDKVGLFVSDAAIDWNYNRQGLPRFHDNDFDLDVVISDKKSAEDDILVDNYYVPKLTCAYRP